jgi:hypothetical protein
VTGDLESRVRQLEDRVQISEQVIKYAMGVDRRDWAMFAGCFTDPVYADFSAGGIPAATVSRTDLVARVSTALNGFTATQHISPNHVIEFDASDPDRVVCYSYICAQHLLRGSVNGEFYLLRGSYTNHAPDRGRLAYRAHHPAPRLGIRKHKRRRRSHRPLPGAGTSQPGSEPIVQTAASAEALTPANSKKSAGKHGHPHRHHLLQSASPGGGGGSGGQRLQMQLGKTLYGPPRHGTRAARSRDDGQGQTEWT